ncbi:MAG: hypothetical protein MR393_11195 [Intestinimonas massiliensis]|uniref:hypothetical protein n=1 Tax=Intestinimonas TaxID=1392389 RepID=UPI00242E66D0|nr:MULTISPECIES: hypothetical protein [Intestinimonas]MCI5563690.1 hypothetical protein [Intestinimonas massiliensis (ex Afouda et al. 2020)]MDY5338413.1 hypothetical protein [Intestinimonas sp.]
MPLTNHAYQILETVATHREEQKKLADLFQTLEYMERRTGEKANPVMSDLVFINWRTGEPAKKQFI